jgi:hypothetical protein
MKYLTYIFLLFSLSLFSQTDTCYVSTCDEVTLGSTFDADLDHAWVCSDGNASTSTNPTFTIASNVTCVLTVSGPNCEVTKSVYIVNCPTECILEVDIVFDGTILLAAIENCPGVASFQWQKYNGSTWDNVGTNSNTFNTGGVTGDYKVLVDCGFGCTGSAEIEFDVCPLGITYFGPTTPPFINTLFLTTSGCNGTSKSAEVFKESAPGSGIWTSISTFTFSSLSANVTVTGYGSYKIEVTGCGCTREALYLWGTAPPPCSQFTATITPISNRCEGSDVIFSIASNNQPIASSTWAVDGVTLPSNAYGPAVAGVHIVTLTVTSTYGCTHTASTTFTVNDCCVASNSISPTTPTLCINESQTFTAAAITGSSPYGFAWSYSNGGPPISAGSGTTKVLSFMLPGTYTVTAAMTDNLGCTSTNTATVTVNACTDCVCTPTLALSGCNVAATFGGCAGFNYILEYSTTGASWSTIQSGTAVNFTYNPTANGLYRVTTTKTDCANVVSNILNLTCYVAPCANNPTLTLSQTSRTACSLVNQVISGNTIGGSATTVTATENGAGTVSITWVNPTTFTVTYVPSVGDMPSNVTIVITTDNPLGFPCGPISRTIGISFVQPPIVNITSSASDMCVNTQRLITFIPLGGALTVASGPGVLVGAMLTATGPGNITLNYDYTLNGCTTGYSQVIRVVECNPTLTLSGCILSGSSTGTGCNTYNYNLQFSLNGSSGWTVVSTGLGGSSFSYTPTLNGYYRLVMTHATCDYIVGVNVQVTCVNECTCIPSALTGGCQLAWNGCPGYLATLQKYNGTTWDSITVTSPFSPIHNNNSDGLYRVKYSKSGCPTQYSNTETFNAVAVSNTGNYWIDIETNFGVPAQTFYPCIGPYDDVIYGTQVDPDLAPITSATAANPPSFYTNTFTASDVVTWDFDIVDGIGVNNMVVTAQTSTSISFRFQWINAPVTSTICGASNSYRFKAILQAYNECGFLVYKVYLNGHTVG